MTHMVIFPPSLTFYVDGLPRGVSGQARGPVIFIRKGREDDEGLWLHEEEHVRQWWVLTLLVCALIETIGHVLGAAYPLWASFILAGAAHPALYWLSTTYRASCEAKAYAEQVKEDQSDIDLMSVRLASDRYELGIDALEAEKMIRKFL